MLQPIGDIILTSEYYDCECPDDGYRYIHSVSEPACPKCGVRREDGPDSHLSEVVAAGLPIHDWKVG